MKRMMLAMLILGLSFSAQIAQADWTPAKRITWTSNLSIKPAIAIDSYNDIHVVWMDTPGNYEIYYKKSTDGGGTWTASKRLTWTSGSSSSPAIAIDSINLIHVVWHDYDSKSGNYEIFYKRSADRGATWSTAKTLTWTSASYVPTLAIDSDNTIHVVWKSEPPGNNEIYYTRSIDGGATWSTTKRLTWTSGNSYAPAIAISSSNTIYVVWYDDTPGNPEIYHKRSTDGGATWSTAKRLTWTSGVSSSPAIVVNSFNVIYVAWDDDTPGNAEIYHIGSLGGGTLWTAPTRLTWNSGGSSGPAMAIDSGNTIHIVWEDSTPGNYEIYYKNGN